MTYLIIVLLLMGVVWLVSEPLRRGRGGAVTQGATSMQRIDLEAARDAKLREIRDTELDHQTGKLSDADYTAIDSTLRAEAVELLHQLDGLEPGQGGSAAGESADELRIGERPTLAQGGSGADVGEDTTGLGEDTTGLGEDATASVRTPLASVRTPPASVRTPPASVRTPALPASSYHQRPR